MPLGTVATFLVPPAPKFQNPDLARMVFWHLPCALASTLFLVLAPYFALRYLRGGDARWDVRALAAMELGTLLGVLTLLTGMLFAKTQWGAWWNWDPRQSSYLMVMLIAAAYFALRGSTPDSERRAANSAGYLLASALPVLFLVFVYPRLPQVMSLHPNVVQEGTFDPVYRGVFYAMLALLGGLSAWLYRLRVRAGLLEREKEKRDAELDDRDRTGPARVVRPVRLSDQGGA